MNSFKTPILKVTGIVALIFLLAFGCAKTPKEPNANINPDTFISSFNINIAPDSSTYYGVTVYWRGSDLDGEPVAYRYWIDNGDTTFTTNTSATVSLSFPSVSTSYTFYAESRDDQNGWDTTPANININMVDVRNVTDPTFLPNTEGLTVPPDGAITSRGVPFTLSGTDVDGIVTGFQWAVDDPTVWTDFSPSVITVSSSIGEITLMPAQLSLGPHTVFFRSIDNMGNFDPSPLSISIICQAGFAPEVSVSIKEGQSFIVPYTAPTMTDFTVSFTGTVDFYYGKVDSFVVTSSEGVTLNTTDTEANLGDISSGNHWVDVMAYDAAGNSSSTGHVNYVVNELPSGNGVLCVNGVDWGTYGSQINNLWTNGSPWGNRTNFKTWDLFDTSPLGPGTAYRDSLLGVGSIPSWMFDTDFFNAIVWVGNEYAGDFAYWEDSETDIMAYLQMGGNVLLPVRFGSDWFFDDLSTYCGIVADSWVSPGADILTAKDARLTDLNVVQGQASWEIPDTDNPDNVWIYEAATVAPGMQAGFITLPNGEGGGGGFCYIAGRPYRWNQDDLKSNIDVILTTFFGIN